MADSPDDLRSVEAMAFTVLLKRMDALEQSVKGLEAAMKSMPLLLKKIIDHLEAQTHQPEVPIASYAQLYPEIQDAEEPDDVQAADPLPPLPPPRRWWVWFMREASS